MATSAPGAKPKPSPATNKPFVLVPLYIYPFPTAWEPLYVAADSHPELDFFVVVNPNSGPGPGILPDANYIEALARLTAAPNVKVIGYVHCSYGKRLLDELVAEVSAYRGWTHASERREDGKVCFPTAAVHCCAKVHVSRRLSQSGPREWAVWGPGRARGAGTHRIHSS